MGVVRIDDELLKRAKEFLDREENKYRYSSLASFLNFIINEKLKEIKKEKGGRKDG